MIIICEPTCKNFSHEKINEGFLFLTKKSFPNEKIIFLAHKTHINNIKNNFKSQNIKYDGIKFINIFVSSNNSIFGFLIYCNLIFKLRRLSKYHQTSKILFLSNTKLLLFSLKNLWKIKRKKFFVFHSELEELNISDFKFDNKKPKILSKNIFHKLKNLKLAYIKNKINAILIKTDPLNYYLKKIKLKDVITSGSIEDFNFISISGHISKNLNDKLDVLKFNIHTLYYPQIQIYKTYKSKKINTVKFGVFGYGDSKTLYYLNQKLKKLNIKKKFEIWIIGMDNRGVEDFDWTIAPSRGRPMKRIEMQYYLEDIHFQLILYSKDRYKLSCSGSIIEAISNYKPILHLENECINHFNNYNSIGYSFKNIEEMAIKIKSIVDCFPYSDYQRFMDNFNKKKSLINPVNQIEKFKQILN